MNILQNAYNGLLNVVFYKVLRKCLNSKIVKRGNFVDMYY